MPDARPIYVPYFPVRSKSIASIVALLDSDERVYLGNRRPKIRASSLDEEEKKDHDPVADAVNAGSHLDLGTEPLQRIVDEIHRLTTETAHYSFDSKAARAAGLLRYGDYLQGKAAGKPIAVPGKKIANNKAAKSSYSGERGKSARKKSVSWR